MLSRLITWVLALSTALCLAPSARAADKASFQKNNPKVLTAFRDVVAKPAQSTVRVLCDGKETALGTVVGADGWILSKASELKGKITCKLRDGRELEAKLLGVHESFDLAMLKIEVKDLKPIVWSDSKGAAVGDWVATTGLDEDPLAVGVVSVATRNLSAKGLTPPNPANSGYLGVGLDNSDGKVKIGQVMPGAAAEKAGLKSGDIIISLGAKLIEDPEAFVNAIQRHKPGDVVTIKIKRGDEEKEVQATLGKRPQGRGDVQNQMGGDLSNRRGGFPTILQHDSVIRPRDCGGPIVDLDGKVLGINIARAGRTETYAVPAEAIAPLLADLKSGRLAPKVPTPAEELAAAQSALRQAEAEKAAADKKLAEARQTMQKAEADKAAADKKLAEARQATQKAEADKAAAEKKLADAKAALAKAEADEKQAKSRDGADKK